MTGATREEMLARIQRNIERYGHHVYLVAGKQTPRFMYTIGLSPAKGVELILGGAAIYSNEEAKRIIDQLAQAEALAPADGPVLEVDDLGSFSLRRVDGSWTRLLVLGALDYYGQPDVPALQIVPDDDHLTIDVPDLSRPRSADSEPAWRWLTEPWELAVPDHAVAVTNLAALLGEPVTEAARWESDEWELFAGAGPDVPPNEIRRVPLGTLLSADPSLTAVLSLELGKGLWRSPADLNWHSWGK